MDGHSSDKFNSYLATLSLSGPMGHGSLGEVQARVGDRRNPNETVLFISAVVTALEVCKTEPIQENRTVHSPLCQCPSQQSKGELVERDFIYWTFQCWFLTSPYPHVPPSSILPEMRLKVITEKTTGLYTLDDISFLVLSTVNLGVVVWLSPLGMNRNVTKPWGVSHSYLREMEWFGNMSPFSLHQALYPPVLEWNS